MANPSQGPSQKPQAKKLEVLPYTPIGDVIDQQDGVINNYRSFLRYKKINTSDFKEVLSTTLIEKGYPNKSILATEYKSNTFIIHLEEGKVITISQFEVKKYLVDKVLGGSKIKSIEKKAANLVSAIESIYTNNSLFGKSVSAIDNKDRVRSNTFGKELKGKNLEELKILLDIENQRLLEVYNITGQTKKKEALLKNELKFYAGIGDKYEGGARYFSLSSDDINKKTTQLMSTMSTAQIFDYIKHNNDQIHNNFRRGELTAQVNLKLMSSLYKKTLERLKKENVSNKIFIEFAKLITGRGRIERDIRRGVPLNNVPYKDKTSFQYERIDIAGDFEDSAIANRVLIHVMYKEGGVIENMLKTQDIKTKVEDTEMAGKEPKGVISEAITILNSINKSVPHSGEILLKEGGFGGLIGTNKKYNELSFDEKISIGAIVRIVKIVKKSSPAQLQNPNFVQEQILSTVGKAYKELNDSFSDNFDETLSDWNGISAKDLGLKGERAEIFELYQDINGNQGAIDWKDTNRLGVGSIVLGVGLIAGVIIIGPLIAAAVTTGTAISAGAMLVSGAKLGFVTGVAANVFSHQGYDDALEGLIDVSSQIVVDTIFSALFNLGGLSLLQKLKVINPNLILGYSAWLSRAGIVDKSFIGAEVVTTGMVVSPTVSSLVSRNFPASHFDTDKTTYQKELQKKKLDK